MEQFTEVAKSWLLGRMRDPGITRVSALYYPGLMRSARIRASRRDFAYNINSWLSYCCPNAECSSLSLLHNKLPTFPSWHEHFTNLDDLTEHQSCRKPLTTVSFSTNTTSACAWISDSLAKHPCHPSNVCIDIIAGTSFHTANQVNKSATLSHQTWCGHWADRCHPS